MTAHSAILGTDGVHGIVAASNLTNANLGPYANAAGRLTAGALLSSADAGKVCKQTDTNQFWMFLGSGAWQRVSGPKSVYSDSSTARTVNLTDADALGLFSAACVVTIPLNASVAFPIGSELEVCQIGTSPVSFSPVSGSVILQAPDGKLATRVQFSIAKARKIGTDTWLVSGDTAALVTGDFGSIFTAAGLTVAQYLRADLGLTKTGSIVNSWAGQTGPTVAEGTSTVGIGNATTGLNGHAGIASDGSTQYGKYTLALAAPGTTPTHMWTLVRLLALPSGFGYLDAQGTNIYTSYINTGTTDLRWQNTSLVFPITMTLNTWGCLEQGMDNTSSSYMKFGAGSALTGNPGNNASTGLRGIFAQEGGAGKGSFEILAKVICTGTLANFITACAAAKTYAQGFYGGSVT